jgi:hypothetical protein
MKKFVAVMTIIFYAQVSLAGEIWVTTAGLSSERRLSEIAEASAQKIAEPDFVSFYEGQLRTPVLKNVLSQLLERETLAQKSFVSGDFRGALEQYEKLLTELSTLPNVSGVEKITLAVLVNIAQLKTMLKLPDAENAWIQAHAWSPNAQLSDDEFSPQMVKKFASIYPEKPLKIEIDAYSESTVYVDGRRAQSDGENFTAKVQPGRHQACVLAPGAAWACKSFDVDASRAADPIQIEPSPVVEGSCDDPHYVGPALPQNVKVLVHFENENCERIYSQQRWYSLLGHHIESLVPQTSTLYANEMREAMKPQESTWSKLSHSTWFWAGVSAVVIGAIVISAQNQNHETVVVPSQSFR